MKRAMGMASSWARVLMALPSGSGSLPDPLDRMAVACGQVFHLPPPPRNLTQ